MNSCSRFRKKIHNCCNIIPVPCSTWDCASSDIRIRSKVGTNFLCPFKSRHQGMIKVGKSLWKSPFHLCSAQTGDVRVLRALPTPVGASPSQEIQQPPWQFLLVFEAFSGFSLCGHCTGQTIFLCDIRAYKGLCGAVTSVPLTLGQAKVSQAR